MFFNLDFLLKQNMFAYQVIMQHVFLSNFKWMNVNLNLK